MPDDVDVEPARGRLLPVGRLRPCATAASCRRRATEAGVTFVRGTDFFPGGADGAGAARLAFSFESTAADRRGRGDPRLAALTALYGVCLGALAAVACRVEEEAGEEADRERDQQEHDERRLCAPEDEVHLRLAGVQDARAAGRRPPERRRGSCARAPRRASEAPVRTCGESTRSGRCRHTRRERYRRAKHERRLTRRDEATGGGPERGARPLARECTETRLTEVAIVAGCSRFAWSMSLCSTVSGQGTAAILASAGCRARGERPGNTCNFRLFVSPSECPANVPLSRECRQRTQRLLKVLHRDHAKVPCISPGDGRVIPSGDERRRRLRPCARRAPSASCRRWAPPTRPARARRWPRRGSRGRRRDRAAASTSSAKGRPADGPPTLPRSMLTSTGSRMSAACVIRMPMIGRSGSSGARTVRTVTFRDCPSRRMRRATRLARVDRARRPSRSSPVVRTGAAGGLDDHVAVLEDPRRRHGRVDALDDHAARLRRSRRSRPRAARRPPPPARSGPSPPATPGGAPAKLEPGWSSASSGTSVAPSGRMNGHETLQPGRPAHGDVDVVDAAGLVDPAWRPSTFDLAVERLRLVGAGRGSRSSGRPRRRPRAPPRARARCRPSRRGRDVS